MRLARIAGDDGPRPVVQDGRYWREVVDPFADDLAYTGRDYPLDDVRLLAPVQPVVVVGLTHSGSRDDRPPQPQAFTKSARTVTGPGGAITVDDDLGQVNIETELAIVIRRSCRRLTVDTALDAVLGYTIANDVTLADQMPLDRTMTQAKNGDGFTPLGPWIETDLDPRSLSMSTQVNGATIATASTAQLAWTVAEQLAYLTRYMRLGPGDVVLTGCPGTFAPVKPGDQAVVTIDGIGELSNPIRTFPMNP
jgi:2-keto-4-pentenoate hydratase/2-oxohepta-3-ene-1,7-dioic acid hydratase in catechol pathway